MAKYDVVVIGASAGGIEPLKQLFNQIPANIGISFFVVLHLEANRKSFLKEILVKNTELLVEFAEDNMAIKPNCVYIAPPNKHLLIIQNKMSVTQGPKINYVRPAIDLLFSSAAHSFQSRVMGVLLSGLLDDGTSGLQDIKNQGGLTVLQDPGEALNPDMLLNALEKVPIDYILPTVKIAKLIIKFSHQNKNKLKKIKTTDTLIIDEDSQKFIQTTEEELNKIGAPSVFTCPECHGTLWQLNYKKSFRYRCRIGHAYNLKSLMHTQNVSVENTLWAGVRALEENSSLSERIAKQLKNNNHLQGAKFYFQKAKNANNQALALRKIILSSDDDKKN